MEIVRGPKDTPNTLPEKTMPASYPDRGAPHPLTLVELMGWDARQAGGAEGFLRNLNVFMFRQTSIPLRIHLVYRGEGAGRTYREEFPNGILIYHELPKRKRWGLLSLHARIADFNDEIFRITSDERVDVLHVHDLVAIDTKTAAFWAGIRFGIPWVATSEWTMSWSLRSPRILFDTFTAWLFSRGARGLIGLTEDALAGLGGPKLFCACGVDLDFFHPAKGDGPGFRRRSHISAESALLFYPARFERRKGHPVLVEVAERLRRIPGTGDFCFVLMGSVREPDYFKSLRDLIRKRNLENNFRFLASGGADEVRDGFAAADVTVFPSLREGLGIIALESMAMQKPVVAHDIPGLNKVLENGVTGYMVPPGNADRMAKDIATLLRDPALRKSMGENGRKQVEKNWGIQDTAAKHLDLYGRLARRKS